MITARIPLIPILKLPEPEKNIFEVFILIVEMLDK
jgi:hypothetical protein